MEKESRWLETGQDEAESIWLETGQDDRRQNQDGYRQVRMVGDRIKLVRDRARWFETESRWLEKGQDGWRQNQDG